MLSLSGKALVICHPERSEGSPGKAKPADLILPWHTLRGKLPFREYALPLRRGRQRNNKGGRMTDRLSRECRLIKTDVIWFSR